MTVSAREGHVLSSAVTMNTGSSGCFFWMAFQASNTAFVSSPTCSARPVTCQRATSTSVSGLLAGPTVLQAEHQKYCARTCSWSTTNRWSAAAALSATSTAAEVACALLAAAAAFCSSSTRLCSPASLFRSAALAAAGNAALSMLCANTAHCDFLLFGASIVTCTPHKAHTHEILSLLLNRTPLTACRTSLGFKNVNGAMVVVLRQTWRSPAISASNFEASSASAASMAFVRPSALLTASSASEAVTAITRLMPCATAFTQMKPTGPRDNTFQL